MECEQARGDIAVDLMGALDEADKEPLTRHVRSCATCCAETSELAKVLEVLRATTAPCSETRLGASESEALPVGPKGVNNGSTGLQLDRVHFGKAVRTALRDIYRADMLLVNPLLNSRLVRTSTPAGRDLVQSLRRILVSAVNETLDDPNSAGYHRVLATTFLSRISTQVAAAERLGLAYGTYRRHLAKGLEQVCEQLWQRELGCVLTDSFDNEHRSQWRGK
ncbi:hypothetical protein ACIP10_36515 [Streptomyces galbus]|uniref:hypothetical protein n=1 Tax=Streptomyces galbus TaxID=33898 RepID=UPI003809CBC2